MNYSEHKHSHADLSENTTVFGKSRIFRHPMFESIGFQITHCEVDTNTAVPFARIGLVIK